MNYRKLGRTDLMVSPLALGTVELGMDYGIPAPGAYGRPGVKEGIRMVHAALDAGINLIDTAQAYGESEAVLGQAMQGRRDQVVLATKVTTQRAGQTLRGDELRRTMQVGLEKSLRALQTDYVDIWQIHNVDGDLLAQADLVREIFDQARQKGQVGWTGGSFYGDSLPRTALRSEIFDVMQVTYSVLDQRLADHFLDGAAAHGVGIVVRSVLLKGALTERAGFLPESLEPLKERSRQFRQRVAQSALGLTAAQTALAFALAEPRIGSVLMGIRSQAELTENLAALATPLPADLLASLRQLRLDDPDLLNPGTWGIG